MKAAEYKDVSTRHTPRNFSFNAFKPQIDHKAGTKRKNSGFAKAEPKKTKVEEEPKVEEAKVAEEAKVEEAKVVEEAK